MKALVAAALAALPAVPALAQQMTGDVNVTMVRTGWNADSFAVVTRQPVVNPARCRAPDGYISHSSLPGYNTYYAAALAALTANLPVQVTVDAGRCFADRPVIIGINVVGR